MYIEEMTGYETYLRENEKSAGTIEKYLRDVRALLGWLEGTASNTGSTTDAARTTNATNAADAAKAASTTNITGTNETNGENNTNGATGVKQKISKENILSWRAHLRQRGLAPRTVNAMLSAVNGFLRYLGKEACCVRFLKVQRRLFRDNEKDLTRAEYGRLLKAAEERGRERLTLLMETLCATGIRVGELRFITVEAAQQGQTDILSKGKARTILLPGKLCRKLKKYAKKHRIPSGPLFRTRGGRALSRHQVWAEMKRLCGAANVDERKVFPHNLRHLFAVSFYTICKDIVKLADVLGHASIETTRIYLISTGTEHRLLLERLRLVR